MMPVLRIFGKIYISAVQPACFTPLEAINDPAEVAITAGLLSKPQPASLSLSIASASRVCFLSTCAARRPRRVRLNTTGERSRAKKCDGCQGVRCVSRFSGGYKTDMTRQSRRQRSRGNGSRVIYLQG